MSVRITKRARDGHTVYSAVFYGPDGLRRVVKVRVLPETASATDHKRAHAAAENKAHEERAKVESGSWVDPRTARPVRIMFAALVKKFLETVQTRTGSVQHYRERLRPALEAFGERAAAAVRPEDVERYRKAREEEVSPTTVRQDLVALSSLYRWAKARAFVAENPADADLVKRPAKARPDPHPLSLDEEIALLDACLKGPAPKPDAALNPRRRKKPFAEGEIGYPWLRPILELALETGADRSELRDLNWTRHIDRDRRLIRLPRAKTGVPRALPYAANARIRRVLAEAAKVEHKSGTVFLDPAGQPLDAEALKTAMRRVWKRAGITKPRPWKTLRATFATRKAEAGVDVPTIAALMGLTTSHVLEHYVKPSGRHLEAAMADSHRTRRGRSAKAPVHPQEPDGGVASDSASARIDELHASAG